MIVTMLRVAHGNKPQITEPVAVTLRFYMTKAKSNKSKYPQTNDLDNCIKGVLDALSFSRKPALGAGILHNDHQVIELHATKEWSREGYPAGVAVELHSLE